MARLGKVLQMCGEGGAIASRHDFNVSVSAPTLQPCWYYIRPLSESAWQGRKRDGNPLESAVPSDELHFLYSL